MIFFRFLLVVFVAIFLTVSRGYGIPNKSQACSMRLFLNQFSSESDPIHSVYDLADRYDVIVAGLSAKLTNGKDVFGINLPTLGVDLPGKCRYLYSVKWGWIDLVHFSAGFFFTYYPRASGLHKQFGLPFFMNRFLQAMSFDGVLVRGEEVEKTQAENGGHSAWDYEDLISNALGAFLGYKFADRRSDLSLAQWLRLKLYAFGFVNDYTKASNFDEMPDTIEAAILDSTHVSHRYEPQYTIAADIAWNAQDLAFRDAIVHSVRIRELKFSGPCSKEAMKNAQLLPSCEFLNREVQKRKNN